MTSQAASSMSKGEESDHSTPSRTSESGDRPFNVYVKSFSPDTDDKKLENIFSKFGSIQSCTVLRDHSGKSKQVGFVQFSSEDEATKCIEQMHGKEGFGSKPLHVALTSPKPPRTPRRIFAELGMGMPFAASMGQPVLAAMPMAAAQPGMFTNGMHQWPAGTGMMPFLVFPSFQPFPAPFPQQRPPVAAVGYDACMPQPAAGPPSGFPAAPQPMQPGQPCQPFVMPFNNSMMVPMRPFPRMPALSFSPGFCGPPRAYGWGNPSYSNNPTNTGKPLQQSPTHFVS